MKRVIIILSLIYYISCSSLCMNTETYPTNKQDCYQRETSTTQSKCCFLTTDVSMAGTKATVSICSEVPIGYDLEEYKKLMIQQLETQGMTVQRIDVDCAHSYLKIGFLLILFFLL